MLSLDDQIWLESKLGFVPVPRLLYKASLDGFEARTFHDKVDDKGRNVIIIKAQDGLTAGAFVNGSWESPLISIDPWRD